MKKNKIFMIAALIAGVLALTGCDLLGAVKELAQDKWCKKDVMYGDKPVSVYMYYTNKEDAYEGRIEMPAGLTVVVEAEGKSISVFGEELLGDKFYVTKNIKKGQSLADAATDAGAIADSTASKNLVINDTTWLAAYEMFKTGEKDVDAPASARSSSGFEDATELATSDFWKQLFAEKLIEILLGE